MTIQRNGTISPQIDAARMLLDFWFNFWMNQNPGSSFRSFDITADNNGISIEISKAVINRSATDVFPKISENISPTIADAKIILEFWLTWWRNENAVNFKSFEFTADEQKIFIKTSQMNAKIRPEDVFRRMEDV